jgi:hypothetical protein|tara:strand:+ start:56 stop:229 length:174 start_codon:yes stop_codon:yes gene_type:complete
MSWLDDKNHCAGCGVGVMGFYDWRPNEFLCADCLSDWEKTDAENRLEETDERAAQCQ